eukprot:scaffold22831_cov62-Isochrysis_galbana.AAC.1
MLVGRGCGWAATPSPARLSHTPSRRIHIGRWVALRERGGRDATCGGCPPAGPCEYSVNRREGGARPTGLGQAGSR